MSGARHGVAYDLLGAQCSSWDRGIARLTIEVGQALIDGHPEAMHSMRASSRYGVTPPVQRLLPSGWVQRGDVEPLDAEGRRPSIYHVASPFEVQRPIDELLPTWSRSPEIVRVATVYDLIPMLFPDRYLGTTAAQAWYRSRITLLRSMDHLLTISDHTRDDVIEHLGLPPERVTSVHTGVDGTWERARSIPREIAYERLTHRLPSLRESFVFYVGGPDSRKNVPTLVRAWLALGPERRAGHQLVVGGNLGLEQVHEIERLCAQAGVDDDELLLTGYIDDDSLVRLYRCCSLFVFPSRYEGAGLPMLEAMATGAVVVGARNSSISEILVDDEAMFDAEDPVEMGDVIARHLVDEGARARRLAHAERIGPEYTWSRVADRTAAVYAAIEADRHDPRWRPRRPARPGPRLTVVASQRSSAPEAALATAIAASLAEQSDRPVDFVSDRLAPLPAGVRGVPALAYLGERAAGTRDDHGILITSGTGPSAFQWSLLGAIHGVGLLTSTTALDSVVKHSPSRQDGGRWLRNLLVRREPEFVERFGDRVEALEQYGSEFGLGLVGAWAEHLTSVGTTAPAVKTALQMDRAADLPTFDVVLPAIPIEETAARCGTLILPDRRTTQAQLVGWVRAALAVDGPVTVVGNLVPMFPFGSVRVLAATRSLDRRALIGEAATVLSLDSGSPVAISPLMIDAAAGGARVVVAGRPDTSSPDATAVIAASDHLLPEEMEAVLTAPLPAFDHSARPTVEALAADLLARSGV